MAGVYYRRLTKAIYTQADKVCQIYNYASRPSGGLTTAARFRLGRLDDQAVESDNGARNKETGRYTGCYNHQSYTRQHDLVY